MLSHGNILSNVAAVPGSRADPAGRRRPLLAPAEPHLRPDLRLLPAARRRDAGLPRRNRSRRWWPTSRRFSPRTSPACRGSTRSSWRPSARPTRPSRPSGCASLRPPHPVPRRRRRAAALADRTDAARRRAADPAGLRADGKLAGALVQPHRAAASRARSGRCCPASRSRSRRTARCWPAARTSCPGTGTTPRRPPRPSATAGSTPATWARSTRTGSSPSPAGRRSCSSSPTARRWSRPTSKGCSWPTTASTRPSCTARGGTTSRRCSSRTGTTSAGRSRTAGSGCRTARPKTNWPATRPCGRSCESGCRSGWPTWPATSR